MVKVIEKNMNPFDEILQALFSGSRGYATQLL